MYFENHKHELHTTALLCFIKAFWMLPNYAGRHGGGEYGGWPRSGEIDIMEARGNRKLRNVGIEYMASTLHWGTDTANKFKMTQGHKKAKSKTLADGFHKYEMLWDQDGFT